MTGPCAVFAGRDALPAFEKRAVLDVVVTAAESGMPVVVGRTNFMDATKLMVSVERPGKAPGQVKTDVRAGCFEAGPFFAAEPLPPGRYKASVVVPIAAVQPPEVAAAMGQHGEKLRGPQVTATGFGGRVVEAEVAFSIGDAAAIAEAEAAARAETAKRRAVEAELRRDLGALVAKGRAMEPLRGAVACRGVGDGQLIRGDAEGVAKTISTCAAGTPCGRKMDDYEPEASALRKRADDAGNAYLKMAATDAQICVTCLHDAIEFCRFATESLRGWDGSER